MLGAKSFACRHAGSGEVTAQNSESCLALAMVSSQQMSSKQLVRDSLLPSLNGQLLPPLRLPAWMRLVQFFDGQLSVLQSAKYTSRRHEVGHITNNVAASKLLLAPTAKIMRCQNGQKDQSSARACRTCHNHRQLARRGSAAVVPALGFPW